MKKARGKKAIYYIILFAWTVQKRRTHRDRKIRFPGLSRRRNGVWLLMSSGFLFGVIKIIFWNEIVAMVVQPCESAKNQLIAL